MKRRLLAFLAVVAFGTATATCLIALITDSRIAGVVTALMIVGGIALILAGGSMPVFSAARTTELERWHDTWAAAEADGFDADRALELADAPRSMFIVRNASGQVVETYEGPSNFDRVKRSNLERYRADTAARDRAEARQLALEESAPWETLGELEQAVKKPAQVHQMVAQVYVGDEVAS